VPVPQTDVPVGTAPLRGRGRRNDIPSGIGVAESGGTLAMHWDAIKSIWAEKLEESRKTASV
jgi:hypothetical protein